MNNRQTRRHPIGKPTNAPSIYDAFCPECREPVAGKVRGPIYKLTSPKGRIAYCDAARLRHTKHQLAKLDGTVLLAIQEKLVSVFERVAGNLCPTCENRLLAWAKIVRDGGVMFSCAQCGGRGVLKPDSLVAKATREAAVKQGLTTDYNDPKVKLELKSCEEHYSETRAE